MKKFSKVIALAAVTAMVLSGCSSKPKETEKTTEKATAAQTQETEKAEEKAAEAKAAETEAKVIETEAEAVETEAALLETEAEVIETEAELAAAAAEAIETEAEAIETEAEIVETEAEAVETEAEVIETEAEIVETEAEAVETEAEAIETEAEIVETEAEAVETEAEEIETEMDDAGVELAIASVIAANAETEADTEAEETEAEETETEITDKEVELAIASVIAAFAETEEDLALEIPETVVEGKLIVGTEAGFAPYEYLVGDEVVGIDMDIAQAIADELGLELEIQNMDFDGALLAVQKGKVDIVAAGVSVSPEREEVMDFTSKYIDSKEVVVVNAKDPKVKAPTADELKDKTVAVQQGNIADLWVSNPDNASPKSVQRYTKFAQAAIDLANGKIDCIIMDEAPAKELVAGSSDLEILDGDPLFEDSYAVAVKKGNTAMTDFCSAVIDGLILTGEMDEIIAAHSIPTAETEAE